MSIKFIIKIVFRKMSEDTGGFNSQRQAEYFILQQVIFLS